MLHKIAVVLAIALSAISAEAASIDKRIVGGEDAKDGEFPFIVDIHSMEHVSPTEFALKPCAGILLNKYTVLTAAHCIRYRKGEVTVKAGTADISKPGVTSEIVEGKMYPHYRNYKTLNVHDLGVMILKQGFDESETVGYAKLAANGSDPEVSSTAIAIGWGKQNPISSDPQVNKLSKVVIPIRPREDCWKLVADADKGERENIICAGDDAKTTCKGDSGGPLIDQKTGHVIGIVSTGTKDEEGKICNKSPVLFTRVSSYLPFINENLVASGPGPSG